MVDGAKMSTGLYRLLWRRFNRIGQSLGSPREAGAGPRLKSALIALVVVMLLLVGAGAWLVMSIDDSESADNGVTRVAEDATTDSTPANPTPASSTPASQAVSQGEGTSQGGGSQPASANQGQANAAPGPATPEDKPTASIEPPAVDGLRISSQSWRRGGLGSKALMTFTLRNDNPYAIKDVALACAFSRRDGSHLTDRTRIVPGPVGMKSRKTFAAVHVGFVNVNASKAKCTLVAASKI
jgi:hypothetical protein